MNSKMAGVAAVLLMASGAGSSAVLAQGEDPKDIVAVQIRKQGHVCEKPASAVLDKDLSKPDEPVWTLTCEGAVYRVRMMPDQAAVVETIK